MMQCYSIVDVVSGGDGLGELYSSEMASGGLFPLSKRYQPDCGEIKKQKHCEILSYLGSIQGHTG